MGETRVGVDVGGTFTDVVALGEGGIRTAKVPSTPRDQSEGVVRALKAVGSDAQGTTSLAHGTTVATNALLERTGARIALVTTEGFRDVLEIGRQNRPSLYDLTLDRPPPLVPRELRCTVRERTGREGELEPLDDAGLQATVARLQDFGVEGVAVCLLWSFAHPEHERRVGEALREALPGVHISLSSEVLPEFREFERFATTAADAYLAPKLAGYLDNLGDRVRRAGSPSPLVMQSSGGVIEMEAASRRAAACVLSGPAAGVVGAAYAAGASGYEQLLTFDMGGTSTDVAPVIDGEIASTTESVLGGVPIRFPMVDVHSVSAGGGSIAWVDEGGALRIGPRSAGAEPGPAAYGKGGDEPTVTDANLLLGYLEDGARLGDEVELRRGLAEQTLRLLGDKIGLTPLQTALGVVHVANAEMVRALRVISVQRGLDPRDFVLVAFGGAGPMHACALAEELGVATVLVPKGSGVLSALGLAVSDLRRDYTHPFIAELASTNLGDVIGVFEDLERAAAGELDDPKFQRRADLRYRGQSFELTVDAGNLAALDELEARFNDAHERQYAYRMEHEEVELVNLRLVATQPFSRPPLVEVSADEDPVVGDRRANFDGDWIEVPLLERRRMGAGSEVRGPAIVDFPEATCIVRAGWQGAVDGAGTLVLEKT